MPNEFHLIDGFEGLRAAFAAANPSAPEPDGVRTPADVPVERRAAFEAWVRVALDLGDESPEERRRLRAVCRAAARAGGGPIPAEGELAPLLEGKPKLAEQIARAGARLEELADERDRVRLPGPTPGFTAEAVGWSRELPRLGGVRAWRFLAALGRATIAPEPAVRRFFWRLGLVESDGGSDMQLADAAAAAETVLRATGFSIPVLDRLIRWHVARRADSPGSGRCAKDPLCDGCPFARYCLYRKAGAFAPARASGEKRSAGLDGLKRRFDEHDPASLDDPELLALLLHGASGDSDSLALAEDLLRRFGGLLGLEMASQEELRGLKGMGDSRARWIKVALELGKRAAAQPLRKGETIACSEDVWRAFRNRYRHTQQEHFVVVSLDARNRVIDSRVATKGTLTSSPAHPREVFREPIRRGAHAVVVLHNHPSGDPTPSAEDGRVTSALYDAGNVLGIRLLDHIVLGADSYYSFKDEGRLK